MIIIFFILGLIIGSFANVVVYRLRVAESIMGRSHCPHCKEQIRWYDNIPLVSFILLRGECRDCKGKISWQYPLVELGCALMFALISWQFFSPMDTQSWAETAFYLLTFSMLLVIFAYDLQYMEIPMIVLWSAVGWVIVYFLLNDFANFDKANSILSVRIFSGMLAGIISFAFFFIMASVSKERWMGLGDAYLGFLVGLIVGWPQTLFALMVSFALGAIVGIILMALKKKTLKSQIPFAPFLVLGALIAIVLPKIWPDISYYLFFY